MKKDKMSTFSFFSPFSYFSVSTWSPEAICSISINAGSLSWLQGSIILNCLLPVNASCPSTLRQLPSSPPSSSPYPPQHQGKALTSSLMQIVVCWASLGQLFFLSLGLFPRVELPGQRVWTVLWFLLHASRLLSRKIEPVSSATTSISFLAVSLAVGISIYTE